MALSMDEQRMLAEIERRLADDDPVLAARLTSFRLPRLTLATRSARSRLMTSLLMLVVVGVVAVFVYALIPFRSQADRVGPAHTTASHSATASPGASSAPPAGSSSAPPAGSSSSPAGSPAQSYAHQLAAAIARSAASSPFAK
jgi:cytoskeletal protein RodZ